MRRKSTKSKGRREEYEKANFRRSNRIQTLEEEKMEPLRREDGGRKDTNSVKGKKEDK